jgi:hypothetical protein
MNWRRSAIFLLNEFSCFIHATFRWQRFHFAPLQRQARQNDESPVARPAGRFVCGEFSHRNFPAAYGFLVSVKIAAPEASTQ